MNDVRNLAFSYTSPVEATHLSIRDDFHIDDVKIGAVVEEVAVSVSSVLLFKKQFKDSLMMCLEIESIVQVVQSEAYQVRRYTVPLVLFDEMTSKLLSFYGMRTNGVTLIVRYLQS